MNKVFSVSDINNYIKQMVSSDGILSGLSIRGEISNFKHHYSGHMYFTIKDEIVFLNVLCLNLKRLC